MWSDYLPSQISLIDLFCRYIISTYRLDIWIPKLARNTEERGVDYCIINLGQADFEKGLSLYIIPTERMILRSIDLMWVKKFK